MAHLLAQKDSGSIGAYLTDQCFATEISAKSDSFQLTGLSLLTLKIEMTQKGFENYHRIIEAVFQFLKMVKTTGFKQSSVVDSF